MYIQDIIKEKLVVNNKLRTALINNKVRFRASLTDEEFNIISDVVGSRRLLEVLFDISVDYNLINTSKVKNTSRRCVICGCDSNFISVKRGYNNTCSRQCADNMRINNIKRNKTNPANKRVVIQEQYNSIDDLICSYKLGKVSAKSMSSLLSSNKLIKQQAENKGLHSIKDIYNYYNNVVEDPTCERCNKLLRFTGYANGYVCTKSCISDQRLNKLSKTEVVRIIQDKYIELGLDKFENFSKQCSIYVNKFWPEEVASNRRKLLFDIVNDFKEAPTCKFCGVNNASFSSYKFRYSHCCSPTCMTRYQMQYISPWTIDKKKNMVLNMKSTKLQRYGDENYVNSLKLKQTCANRTQAEKQIINDKRRSTCLSKYGVDSVMKIPDVVAKLVTVKLNKHGYSYFPVLDQKKIRSTMEIRGRWMPLDVMSDFIIYRRVVDRITRKVDISSLPNYHKRGKVNIESSYHLDHRVSVFECFNNNIPSYICASIHNLEMIPAIDNISKGKRCSIELEQLLYKYYNSENEYKL